MGLPESLEGLLHAQAYPHPVEEVELIETHISWVLLAGEFAYKIKRPVCHTFLDLRSLERRRFLCEEEMRLNIRFAPELYLQTCPITLTGREVRIGGSGEAIETAVKMRRFDSCALLDSLLERGGVAPELLRAFGRELAQIHDRLPRLDRLPDVWPAAGDTILRNAQECAGAAEIFGDGKSVRLLAHSLEARIKEAHDWMAERLHGGKVRECHGDLHAGNMIRWADRLVAFDCLEFDPVLRHIDVADEIAFLLSDLEARGCARHAQAFLGGYLAESADYEACRHLPLYRAHRALVRAKVIALRAAEASSGTDTTARLHRSFQARLDCATRCLCAPRPVLVLMSGLSGSGKTWLAQRLAPALGAVHLRSDVERKRLAHLPELASSGSSVGQGLYSDEQTARVYRFLESAADATLHGGYPTIVDATFGRREERRSFQHLASRLGIPVCVVWCEAPLEILEARLTQRARSGSDASEASPSVLRWQLQRHEPIGQDEALTVFNVSSAAAAASGQLLEQIRSLQSSPGS